MKSKQNFLIGMCATNLFINASIAVVGPFYPIIAKQKMVPTYLIGYVFRYFLINILTQNYQYVPTRIYFNVSDNAQTAPLHWQKRLLHNRMLSICKNLTTVAQFSYRVYQRYHLDSYTSYLIRMMLLNPNFIETFLLGYHFQ